MLLSLSGVDALFHFCSFGVGLVPGVWDLSTGVAFMVRLRAWAARYKAAEADCSFVAVLGPVIVKASGELGSAFSSFKVSLTRACSVVFTTTG